MRADRYVVVKNDFLCNFNGKDIFDTLGAAEDIKTRWVKIHPKIYRLVEVKTKKFKR